MSKSQQFMGLILVMGYLAGIMPVSGAEPPRTLTVGGSVNSASDGTSPEDGAWQVYAVNQADEQLTGVFDSGAPNTWQADIGGLSTPLDVGAECMVIVSREIDAGTETHAGYYAVMNHALTGSDPDAFADTTLRPIPVPQVVADASAHLTWQEPVEAPGTPLNDNIVGYNVYRSSDRIAYTQVNTETVTQASYTDPLPDSNGYYYAIGLVFRGQPEVQGATLSAASKEASKAPDVDADGLSDGWEQMIVDADDADDIAGIQDVLGADDFDQDGLSNLREYELGTNPCIPDPEAFLSWRRAVHKLRTIGAALKAYQEDYGVDVFPPSLTTLADEGYLDAEVLMHPADESGGSDPHPYDQDNFSEAYEEGVSFFYELSDAECEWTLPGYDGPEPATWYDMKMYQLNNARGWMEDGPGSEEEAYDRRAFPVVRFFWLEDAGNRVYGRDRTALSLAMDLETVFASELMWEAQSDAILPDDPPVLREPVEATLLRGEENVFPIWVPVRDVDADLALELADGPGRLDGPLYTYTPSADGPEETVDVRIELLDGGTVLDTQTYTLTIAASEYTITFDHGDHGTRSGGGELEQTVAHGEDAEAPQIEPNEGWCFTGWDTDFASVTNNLTVTAQYERITHTLTVASAHGASTPAVGEHTRDWGTELTCSASSPDAQGSTRYVCTGWTGSGSVPATGDAADTGSFAMTEDSSITWNWRTEHHLDTEVAGNGAVDVADGWHEEGSEVSITATPDEHHHFDGWTGDTDGCPVDGASITVPMNRARAITAAFAIDTYTLTYSAGENGALDGASPQSVEHDSDGSSVEAVPDEGYHFVTWSDGLKTASRTDAAVAGDIDVLAEFAINEYEVRFEPGANCNRVGGGALAQTVEHGSDASPPLLRANEGWWFLGWGQESANITGDMTIHAVVEAWTDADLDGIHDTEEAILEDATGSADVNPVGDLDGDGYSNLAEISERTAPLDDKNSPAGFEICLCPEWNLVSVGIRPADPAVAALLRNKASGAAWGWENGVYMSRDEATPCAGMWVEYEGITPTYVLVQGESDGLLDIDLGAGWNLIGVPSKMIAAEFLDGADFIGTVWYWNALTQQYDKLPVSEPMLPGYAYWVYLKQSFTLDFAD